jgi:hypothetical protein
VAAKASAATMLTADSGIASRRRLRDGAGAGGRAALGLFVSGLARSSIAEAPLDLVVADGASVATGAEQPDRRGTVRAGADAPGPPSATSGRIGCGWAMPSAGALASPSARPRSIRLKALPRISTSPSILIVGRCPAPFDGIGHVNDDESHGPSSSEEESTRIRR